MRQRLMSRLLRLNPMSNKSLSLRDLPRTSRGPAANVVFCVIRVSRRILGSVQHWLARTLVPILSLHEGTSKDVWAKDFLLEVRFCRSPRALRTSRTCSRSRTKRKQCAQPRHRIYGSFFSHRCTTIRLCCKFGKIAKADSYCAST